MKEKLDDLIRKSYKNAKLPNEIFKQSYKKLYSKSNHNIYRYIACFIFILSISIISIIGILKNTIFNNPIIINGTNDITQDESTIDNNDDDANYQLPTANETLTIYSTSDSGYFTDDNGNKCSLEEYADSIVILKVDKILYYTNHVKDDIYMRVPMTLAKASVVKSFKGDLIGDFEFMVAGGIISVKDFERTLSPEQKQVFIYNNKSEKEKEETYIDIVTSITMNIPKLKDSGLYLAYLKYDNENFNKYLVVTCMDGLKEYDEKNNLVRNNETKLWETLTFE